jgi:nucleotide-binding universal stress UspA family protein
MATRKQKQKFLVPFNFSRKSEMALDFALRYSAHIDVDIYLFHVFEGRGVDFRKLDRQNEEYLERMKLTVTTWVEQVAKEGIQAQAHDVHRRVANGKPAMEILKMAAGINADMIIMGAPSSFGFRRLLVKTPCTTVLVKDKDPAFVVA